MKPSKRKKLILLAILAGLILTQGCGASKSTSSTSPTTDSGDTGGVTITNEVSSPADMSVGDIIMAQFGSSISAEFDFSGVDPSSEYYLAVGSLDSVFGTHSISIQSALSSDVNVKAFGSEASYETEWEDPSMIDVFEQRLYDVGLALALDPEVEVPDQDNEFGGYKSVSSKAVGVGDVQSFRVLNSLTSMSSYIDVRARARCVEENVIMFVDVETESVNPDDLTDCDISCQFCSGGCDANPKKLCERYNDQIALERSWFGHETDVNGDDKVTALITPQVNRLGGLGGGIITGFFLASDLFPRTDSNIISNYQEIVYMLYPDSSGDYGLVLPKTFTIENLLAAVFSHEFQHVNNYGQRVIMQGGTPETASVNESISHLVEDLVGFGQENYSRVNIFLNDPTNYQLVASGSPNLGERGASYLFMRFLYEQHPDPETFLWNLYHTGKTGVSNIEASFNGTEEDFDQFGEFFMRWMTALAMTNQGLSADSRYVYEPRVFNNDTERWQGVCLVCDADDGRGTVLNGPAFDPYSGSENVNLYSSTGQFYDVSSVPSVMNFDSDNGGTFGTILIRKQ